MRNTIPNRFNVRVYGLLINSNNEVLISDECRKGNYFTKFPGGGLEFGEGIKDALIREFQEEMGIHVTVESLFYVNDFFQVSAYRETDQLLSFYYFVKSDELSKICCNQPLDADSEASESFRWVKLEALKIEELTFPIDKVVGNKLILQPPFQEN